MERATELILEAKKHMESTQKQTYKQRLDKVVYDIAAYGFFTSTLYSSSKTFANERGYFLFLRSIGFTVELKNIERHGKTYRIYYKVFLDKTNDVITYY